MQNLDLERGEGESDAKYLDRLRGMDTLGWSVDDLMARTLQMRYAQRAVEARSQSNTDAENFLAVLQQIRDLSSNQQRDLARWIARGMPAEPPGVTLPRLRLNTRQTSEAEAM